MRYCPHVVHFSGHGVPGGLLFVDDRGASMPVAADALGAVFRALRDNVRLVFLNACYSADQAGAIGEHIDFVVGMQRAFSDQAAIQFARAFYLSLGYGRTVFTAFEAALAALMLEGIAEEGAPQLLVRPGVDPNALLYSPTAG